ncbi:MAG: acylase [Flavobacteriales bacterium]|jgi:acyl-homoserine-lactone acylase|nr:acylase [Flavobacteriales bacterium]
MKKNRIAGLLMIFVVFHAKSQEPIDPSKIDIARDFYGVPHIYGATDAAVAYGLAWAHAEDDFKTIQQSYLAGNGLLTKAIGNAGIPADFISQFIGSQELVEEQYEKQISEEYKKVVRGYAQGLNSYAKSHPEEVLVDELFPVTPKMMLRYAQLQLFISSRGDKAVGDIVGNQVTQVENQPQGSNTFGFNSTKTKDGHTYLAINTHQPLEGPVSWYEAHLCSEEGTNIVGTLFAGSPNILIGVNEYLGWSHTVNNPDKTDVFALEMHPKNKRQYRVDNEYLTLTKKKAKITFRLLGIPIRINRNYYESIFGPTLKNKSGYYAVRTPALFDVRGLEQWWRMNKATSFSEFYDILKMKAIPGYNIGYADRNDTIFYISNGLIPKRAPGYDWKNTVPGNTRKTLWKETYAIEDLPQVIQPKSGYFYNANHSPFLSSDAADNPDISAFSKDMGFEEFDNNRSYRLKELIDHYDRVDFDDFKRIKYDNRFPTPFQYSFMNINALSTLEASKYPKLKVLIERIQNWDRYTNPNSLGAGAFAVFYYKSIPYARKLPGDKIFPVTYLLEVLRETKAYMLKNFKTLDVTLGDFQKLIRGDKEIGIWGMPDVLTAMHGSPYKDGKIKIIAGESYIGLIKFTPEGPEIESVISYGSSDRPDSPHYNDQMDLYAAKKTKKMTLDKAKVYATAVKIYHPN